MQDGQYYEAKLPVVHCPSTVGCRSIITQNDKNQQFFVENEFNLILKSPQNVWIDYVLAVPSNLNELNMNMDMDLNKFLQPDQLDETSKFIAECGKNHFHLLSNTSGTLNFYALDDMSCHALPCLML